MLRISKLTDYAIMLLGHMASNTSQTFAAAELSEVASIAPPTVSKILKALTRSGILTSTRGVKGGYQLSRSPDRISVAMIIHALEGPIALTECEMEEDTCRQSSSCTIRGNWTVINWAIRTALESVTLADMAAPRRQSPTEFTIPVHSISLHPRKLAE
jgi:FeS assembly SUF system regulator